MTEYKIEGRPKTIFRVVKNKQNPYVMIDRRPVDNKNLSFKAKGILTYCLSRPDGWEVNIQDLVNHSTDGAYAIRTGIKELREAHHIAYSQIRDENGHIAKWVLEVYEIPYDFPIDENLINEAEKSLDDDFQEVGNSQDDENQQVDNQQVDNLIQLNNESNNNESNIAPDGAKSNPRGKWKPKTIEEAIFSDQPVTEEMFLSEDLQFERNVEDAAHLICQNNQHLIPLAKAFMMTRGIILSYDSKSQRGHRRALNQMYDAKPNQVKPEHVIEAIHKLKGNGMTVKDLWSVVGTATDLANPMPESIQDKPSNEWKNDDWRNIEIE